MMSKLVMPHMLMPATVPSISVSQHVYMNTVITCYTVEQNSDEMVNTFGMVKMVIKWISNTPGQKLYYNTYCTCSSIQAAIQSEHMVALTIASACTASVRYFDLSTFPY